MQIRARIDGELKRRSDAVLKSLGLDTSSFVSMSLAQLVNRRGLPFAVTEADETYFESEYGMDAAAAARAGRRMKRETARARAAGTLTEVTGAEDLAG